MAETMPKREISPLKIPLKEKTLPPTTYKCPYCKWVGGGRTALDYHLNHFHEEQLAAEGNTRAIEKGDKWGGNYIETNWVGQDWPTPTPEQWRHGAQSVAQLYLFLHLRRK